MDLQHWSKQNGATIQNGKITHRIEIVGNHVHSSAVTNREVHIVHACATGCLPDLRWSRIQHPCATPNTMHGKNKTPSKIIMIMSATSGD
jgi:hypothetical protein